MLKQKRKKPLPERRRLSSGKVQISRHDRRFSWEYNPNRHESATNLERETMLIVSREAIRKKITHQLVDSAKKRSVEIYEELEKEGKFTFPKGSYCRYKYMKSIPFYTFMSSPRSSYSSLYLLRYKESGDRVVAVVSDYVRKDFTWSLEKDQKYLKLEEKITNCNKIKLGTKWDDNNLTEALRIARRLGFETLLDEREVEECLSDYLRTELVRRRFARGCRFCYYLLDENVQRRLLKGLDFLFNISKKFDFSDAHPAVNSVCDEFGLIKGIFSPAELKDPSWVDDKKQKIRSRFDIEMEKYMKSLITRRDYIKLKLELAEDIGIITKDHNTGRYVELYEDIFRGREKLSEALREVDLFCDPSNI